MNVESPGSLLPSISRLLYQVGALERSNAVDLAVVSCQPVFATDAWRKSISEFLRWSGSTLDVSGPASVFELILCHGRVGALALFKSFREHLIGRGGSYEDARARLEALRTIVSMAAHWLRLIDWDLEKAEGLERGDFETRHSERWTVEVPAPLAERLKNAAYWTPGLLPISAWIERLVADKVAELEKGNGGLFPSRIVEGRPVEVHRAPAPEVRRGVPAATPEDRSVRSFWKSPPEEPAKGSAASPLRERPKPPQKQY